MTTENITLTKLEAGEGMVLTNGESHGKTVYLGRTDSPGNWREIPQAEYDRLMAEEETSAEKGS